MSTNKDNNKTNSEHQKHTIKDCSNCGLCKSNCPIFRVLREETKSARGRATLLNNGIADEVFYLCTLCGSCKINCPVGIDLPDEILKMREKLVRLGRETAENKRMIENIKKHGNPYGKIENGKTSKNLYCC